VGYRDEDEAVRSRLDAVLAENAALKAELAEKAQPRGPVAPPAPAPAPREKASSTSPSRTGRSGLVLAALLTFVSLPGVAYTVLAVKGGMNLAPALVMDAVALVALGGVLYAKYGPEEPSE